MDGPAPCCGACGHAAAVAAAGGPAPNPNAHLRVELGPDGAPRDVEVVYWSEHGGEKGATTTVAVDKSYLVLGRRPPADIVVPMDVLSRRQCGFDFSTGEVVVEDLDSACGTYVNGEQITRAALRAGDRVSMGDLVVEVRVGR